jgi:hypothetical protein
MNSSGNFEEDNQLFQCNKGTNTNFNDSSIHLTNPDNFQEISNKIISSEKLETDEAKDFIRKKTLGTRFHTSKLRNKVKKLLKKLKKYVKP